MSTSTTGIFRQRASDPNVSTGPAVRASKIDQRAEDMSARFAVGETLEQIGLSYGVTRERVRQIIKRHGKVTPSDARRARAAAKAKQIAELGAQVTDLVRRYPGLTLEQLAQRLGRTKIDVSTSLDASSRRWIVQQKAPERASHRVWSDTDIAAALQLAAEPVGGPLTCAAYNRVRSDIGGPSGVRIIQRFGTWRAACIAAGVAMGKRPRGDYHRNWTDSEVLGYVVQYFSEPAARGSYGDYTKWASSSARAPSGPTVRNYLGTWRTVKQAALTMLAARERREGIALQNQGTDMHRPPTYDLVA